MITDEDAKNIQLRLRSLSTKHRVTEGDAYTQGQHDGRLEAYELAAKMVEECNHEEACLPEPACKAAGRPACASAGKHRQADSE